MRAYLSVEYKPACFSSPLRSNFRTPKESDKDPSGHCMNVKLIGQIVHGQCLVFFLVPQWVKDDSNLVTTTMLRTLTLAMGVSYPTMRACVLYTCSISSFFIFFLRLSQRVSPLVFIL